MLASLRYGGLCDVSISQISFHFSLSSQLFKKDCFSAKASFQGALHITLQNKSKKLLKEVDIHDGKYEIL